MLTHVVCLKFADPEDATEVARRLSSMEGRIPSMKGIEVGLDVVRSARSYDLVLITRHDDMDGMQAYQVHPVHQEVLAFIKSKGPAAVAVDFTS
jgi:heme-degrading monooxygenase HmoA